VPVPLSQNPEYGIDMSDAEFSVNKFKSLDPDLIEVVIAEAIGKLIGEDCEANLSTIDLAPDGFASHSMKLEISLSYDWADLGDILRRAA
jgi:hypothetical protein